MVFLVTGLRGHVVPAETSHINFNAWTEVAILPGGGSITMHVTDDLSIPADNTASYSGAVRMASGPHASQRCQTDQTALVSEKFLSFLRVKPPVPQYRR